MPLQNQGIQPFIQGVQQGNMLRELAVREEAARQERERQAYAMNKQQEADAVLREVLTSASGKKTAADVLNEISAAAQRSPEAAAKAYEFLKSLSPPLRQQLAEEALKLKRAEMEIDVRKVGLSEEAREKAKFPWWERQENIKYGHDIAKGEANDLRDYAKSAELKKLEAALKKGEDKAKKETTTLTQKDENTGTEYKILLDKKNRGLVLGVMKPGEQKWTFTEDYPRWVLGDSELAELLEKSIADDPRVPDSEKMNEVGRILNNPGAAAEAIRQYKEKQQKTAPSVLNQEAFGAPSGAPPVTSPGNFLQGKVIGTGHFGATSTNLPVNLNTGTTAQTQTIKPNATSPGQLTQWQDVALPGPGSGQSNPFASAQISAPKSTASILSSLLPSRDTGDPTLIGGMDQESPSIAKQLATRNDTGSDILKGIWDLLTTNRNAFAASPK